MMMPLRLAPNPFGGSSIDGRVPRGIQLRFSSERLSPKAGTFIEPLAASDFRESRVETRAKKPEPPLPSVLHCPLARRPRTRRSDVSRSTR